MTSSTPSDGEERRQRLLAIMEQHGLSPRAVAELCHVNGRVTVNRWINGTRFPPAMAIALLELTLERDSA